jgi:hypothetical protein
VGTTGVILQGNTTANPSWSTATYPSDAAQGDILYGSAIHVISALAKNTSATRYLANTGTSNAPQWDQVNLSNGVTSTLAVGSGGTGKTTLTVHGVLLGNATSAINTMSAGTAGQIITSSGALVDPAWTTATYPATIAKGEVLCATNANVIGVVSGTGNLGDVLTSGGAATAPTWQAPAATGITTLDGDSGSATGSTVTISGGTNLTSVAATSTVTINLDAAITAMTSIDIANGGRIGTALVSGNTFTLSAYNVGTTAYVPFVTLTANATVPTCNLDTAVTINSAYIYRGGGTDVAVADGGTGASTLTLHGVLLGEGTSAVGSTTAGTTGQALMGVTAGDPSFTGSPSFSGSVTAATSITSTAGSHVVGATSSDPVAMDLDFLKSRAGSPITFGDVLGNITFQGYAPTSGYVVASQITSTSSGTIANNRVASDLKFYTHPDSVTASTLRMTIAPTGAVTVATPDSGTALTVGGNVYASGLSFDGGTSVMSAYTLYDVATFTPTISFAGGTTGITYTSQSCSYSRIGNICFFQLAIVLSNKGSSTGNLQVNLPLTPAAATRCNVLASVVTYTGESMQGQISTAGYFTIGFSDNAGGAFTTMTNTHCANTTSIRAFGFYWV